MTNPTCEGCPHPKDCGAGRCIDDVAREHIATYRSESSVRIMSRDQVGKFVAALDAGTTGRQIASTNVVTSTKMRFHCETYPLFGAEVAAKLEANRKAVYFKRMDYRRQQTHCKRGHPLSGDNLILSRGGNGGTRKCRACQGLYGQLQPAQIARMKTLLSRGVRMTQMVTRSGNPLYVATPTLINRYRKQDPSFQSFVNEKLADQVTRKRFRLERVTLLRRRQEADDFAAIARLIPAHLPFHVRDDITQNIMEALHDGSLRRDRVRERVGTFLTDHNRMFPTNFAKFGNARLVSLDEVMFEDGSTTRGDTVSEGLWQ